MFSSWLIWNISWEIFIPAAGTTVTISYYIRITNNICLLSHPWWGIMNALLEKAKPSAHSSELSAPAPDILHLRHSLWSKAARDPLHKAEHWQMTRQLHKCGCSHAECLSSLLRAGTKPATVPLIPSNLLEILSNTLLMTVRSSLLQTADLHQQYNHSSNSVFFIFFLNPLWFIWYQKTGAAVSNKEHTIQQLQGGRGKANKACNNHTCPVLWTTTLGKSQSTTENHSLRHCYSRRKGLRTGLRIFTFQSPQDKGQTSRSDLRTPQQKRKTSRYKWHLL